MSILLRPVAVTDLNIKYARDMGNNKLRHYVVPAMTAVAKQMTGETVQQAIRDFIAKTEGITDIVFDEEESQGVSFEQTEDGVALGAMMSPVEVSKIVLHRDREIGKALLKTKAYQMIHQTNYYPTRFHALMDRMRDTYNGFVPSINKLLYKLQGADYALHNPFVRQLPHAPLRFERVLNLVHFISVAFEANDTEKALEALRNDLRILNRAGVIMGHLAMPSVLRLANLTGFGNYYVLFCFPIIDAKRLQKVTKKGPLEIPHRLPLNALLGTKYETLEGGVNWLDGVAPEQKFDEIEFVNVTDYSTEIGRQAVLEAYEKSKDFVNEVAADAANTLKHMEKVSSNSQPTYNNGKLGLALDVTMRNNETGDELNLDSRGREAVSMKKGIKKIEE